MVFFFFSGVGPERSFFKGRLHRDVSFGFAFFWSSGVIFPKSQRLRRLNHFPNALFCDVFFFFFPPFFDPAGRTSPLVPHGLAFHFFFRRRMTEFPVFDRALGLGDFFAGVPPPPVKVSVFFFLSLN